MSSPVASSKSSTKRKATPEVDPVDIIPGPRPRRQAAIDAGPRILEEIEREAMSLKKRQKTEVDDSGADKLDGDQSDSSEDDNESEIESEDDDEDDEDDSDLSDFIPPEDDESSSEDDESSSDASDSDGSSTPPLTQA
jgi:hypothetical protein